jgi:hypothetical protein
MEDEIKVLQDKICGLEKQVKGARRELLEAKCRNVGLAIGDIVVRAGQRYRVVDIDPMFTKPWVSGNPKRKNGTFGTSVRHLYDNWEKE